MSAQVPGYTEDKDALVKRLHRIEGQVRGIEKMVEDDRYCIDILTQIGAVSTALESLAFKILDEHVRHCVAGVARELLDDATRLAKGAGAAGSGPYGPGRMASAARAMCACRS